MKSLSYRFHPNKDRYCPKENHLWTLGKIPFHLVSFSLSVFDNNTTE